MILLVHSDSLEAALGLSRALGINACESAYQWPHRHEQRLVAADRDAPKARQWFRESYRNGTFQDGDLLFWNTEAEACWADRTLDRIQVATSAH